MENLFLEFLLFSFFFLPREVVSRENDETHILNKRLFISCRETGGGWGGRGGSSLPESFSGAVSKLHEELTLSF